MTVRWLVKLGEFNKKRENFLLFSAISAAILCPPLAILIFDLDREVGTWILLVLVSIPAGVVWGIVMWRIVMRSLYHQ